MTTHSAVSLSVSSPASDDEVTVHVVFHRHDPIGLTEVTIDPEPSDHRDVVQVIDAAIERLRVYSDDYRGAHVEDTVVTRLPVPWYAWGR